MKLYFAEPTDVQQVQGPLRFGANGLRRLADAPGLPAFAGAGALPLPDGAHAVYLLVHPGQGEPWRLLRCRTWDGVHYEEATVVFTAPRRGPPTPWLGHACVCPNPDSGEVLALAWGRCAEGGMGVWGYRTADGTHWDALSEAPLYKDHDSFHVMWHAARQQYVAYQITYQPWPKPYADNIGGERRRVLHVRTSGDALTWDPPNLTAWPPAVPAERLVTPDAQDAPELEFYRLAVFPAAGRYVGMMLNYAASPGAANVRHPHSKHGPHLGTEWWVSTDGLAWRRPFRDVFAAGEASGTVSHTPITIGGRHVWLYHDGVFGLPEDRLFFAGALANCEFSTPLFAMPTRPLVLNAEFGYDGHPARGMRGQGYLMAELRDEAGAVIPGFERERCLLHDVDGPARRLYQTDRGLATRLHWQGRLTRELAGRRVTLRLYLRDARVYALGEDSQYA